MRLPQVLSNFSELEFRSACLLVALGVGAHLATPRPAALAATSLSAAGLWASAFWTSRGQAARASHSRINGCLAGFGLALAQTCQAAAFRGDRTWWPQALAPACLALIQTARRGRSESCSTSFLFLATGLALYALDFNVLTLPQTVLGITFAASQALALFLIDHGASKQTDQDEKTEFLFHDGDRAAERDDCANVLVSLKYAAATLALGTGLCSWLFEGPWSAQYFDLSILRQVAVSSTISAALLYCTFAQVAASGSFKTASFVSFAPLLVNASCNASWLRALMGVVAAAGFQQSSTNEALLGNTGRRSQVFFLAISLTGLLSYLACSGLVTGLSGPRAAFDASDPASLQIGATSMQLPNNIHPIKYLVSQAESRYQDFTSRQSRSLREAAMVYKTRYGVSPPPGFDRWYTFARKNDIKVYDDYDIIFDSLQPFWALKPVNIRLRVQEAIGFEKNALLIVIIRDGKVTKLTGGLPWQREALSGMMSSFVEMLPDLDLAFNAHDEPRVIVPHAELSSMITQAREGPLKRASESEQLINSFSSRPQDMSDGLNVEEYKASRFNEFAHQNTWGPSRLSCAPDSPARAVNEDLPDSTASYELGSLGFIYNTTASTDVCQIPSLRGTHAFFDRPNAFNVAHDLVPIFSESKISSFQDIVFPSMWHWYEKLYRNRTEDMHLSSTPTYDARQDTPWDEKKEDLYWRGSTTGGWSENGGWRRHHRQKIVQLLNSDGSASVMKQSTPSANRTDTTLWLPQTVRRFAYADLMNVSFTGVGQCSMNDCAAQREFFDIAPHAPLHTAWQHKHLLDIDGNAFSARFYALLRSNSLVYKAALFREWHDEILHPWLHHIPLSITGRDALEAVRYFAREDEGRRAARRLATAQQDAARTLLRKVDMESWMFRLLLEYARVVDDNRENIGYPG